MKRLILSSVLLVLGNLGTATTIEKHTTADIKQAMSAVYRQYKTLQTGKNADYIPELAKVDAKLFGIAIVTVKGEILTMGDADVPFAIESIAKLFAYALAMQDQGEQLVTDRVGVNATGHAFNSIIAIEERPDHLQNPLVNAGAIQTTALIKGKDSNEKWQRFLSFVQTLSDNKPYLSDAVYQSEATTNYRNRSITELLTAYNMMKSDPLDALDRYTKACSIMVSAKQLALMGATLANHGQHPLTHKQLIKPEHVRNVLSQMVTNGLYETSGAWFLQVGLPAKSGVGGGILAIVPNKMAIVVFSPPLDNAGNSVRAQAVINKLSEQLKLHILHG